MKPLEALREGCKKEIEAGGQVFDEAIFKKALGKVRRWCQNAYGSASLEDFLGENGPSGAVYYYKETLREADGINTANRQNYLSTRRDRKGA